MRVRGPRGPRRPRKAKNDKVFANAISQRLAKTERRSRSVFERGSTTVHYGYKVTQPPTWSKAYGQEVYVEHVGRTVAGYPELERYAEIICDAGYSVERHFDTLYVTKGGTQK